MTPSLRPLGRSGLRVAPFALGGNVFGWSADETATFALLDAFHWWTAPVTLLLTYALFGIEEIGVQIEDPFGADDNDLPLERFCATIEKNLRELLPSETAAADVRAQAG